MKRSCFSHVCRSCNIFVFHATLLDSPNTARNLFTRLINQSIKSSSICYRLLSPSPSSDSLHLPSIFMSDINRSETYIFMRSFIFYVCVCLSYRNVFAMIFIPSLIAITGKSYKIHTSTHSHSVIHKIRMRTK